MGANLGCWEDFVGTWNVSMRLGGLLEPTFAVPLEQGEALPYPAATCAMKASELCAGQHHPTPLFHELPPERQRRDPLDPRTSSCR